MLCDNKLRPLNSGPYLPMLSEGGGANWSDLPNHYIMFPTVNLDEIYYLQFHSIFTEVLWKIRELLFPQAPRNSPLHFWLNHPWIAPDYITKQNDNSINTQKCTDWQLS